MEEIAIEGSLKADLTTKEFEINLDLPNGLKIKGLSKTFLINKITGIPEENGIYILESDTTCYVGQSKNLKDRLKNHKDNNKIDFNRCFIIYHINDIRGHLDFMEAYTIKEMLIQNYPLSNKIKLNPEDDKLSSAKKNTAKKWIDEFLIFLPILGFKKNSIATPNVLINNIKKPINTISINFNNMQIHGKNNNEIFLNCLLEIGLENIVKNSPAILSTAINISDSPLPKKYGKNSTLYLDKITGKNFYVYLNLSNKDKILKLQKIKKNLNLNNLTFSLN
jgi:predicted GIY-YIG superfamily endonuclease